MQLFWLKSFSYKDAESLVVLCELRTLPFLGDIVEHISLSQLRGRRFCYWSQITAYVPVLCLVQ